MREIKKILRADSDFVFFLLILTTIVYITSWRGEFLSDDIAGIQYNTSLESLTVQIKTLNFNNIVNAAIYKTFGQKPIWFHIANTAFHIVTVVIVYILTWLLVEFSKLRLRSSQSSAVNKSLELNLWMPRLSSLLFALHPIETEGVAWISGFPYTAYTLFFLIGFIFFILVLKSDLIKDLVLDKLVISTFFFILSLSASEKAIVFPVLLFAFVIFFLKATMRNVSLTIPSFIVAGSYAFFRFADIGKRIEYVSPTYAGETTVFNPLVQIPIAIYSYIKLFFWPFNLTLYHEFVSFPQWEYYLSIGITTVFLIIIVLAVWKRWKLIAFGLLWFIVSLTPTLLPINIAWIVAERYVRLGSVGFFLAIAALIWLLAIKLSFKKYLKSLVLTLAAILSILTILRNLEWRSQDTLWPATVRESPYSAYAWNNMGDYYGRKNDIENSIRAFETARRLRPRYADATHNLANAYLKINEATKAAQLYREALEYNPTLYQSYQQLGLVMMNQGQYAEAEKYFLQSAKLNPDPFLDHLYIYMNYAKSSNQEKAQEALLSARKLTNNNPQRLQLIQQIISEFETR